MTGLTYEGFRFGLSHLFDSYTYETLPDLIASKKLGQDMEDQIPLCADGLPIWNAFQKFFQGYVNSPFRNLILEDLCWLLSAKLCFLLLLEKI